MKVLEKLKSQGISGLIESAIIRLFGIQGIYQIYIKQQIYPRSSSSKNMMIYIEGDQKEVTIQSLKKSRYSNYSIVDVKPEHGQFLWIEGGMKVKPWTLDCLAELGDGLYYFDEDVNHQLPIFKSQYNPYLLRSYPYIGKAIYGNAELMEKSIYQTALNHPMKHIAKVLFESIQFDSGVNEKNRAILEATLKRPVSILNHLFEVHYPKVQDGISIIIPNKDHIDDLDNCLNSLRKYHTRPLEIIIMENNSAKNETFEYYQSLKEEKVIYYQGSFNYARINNQAIQHTSYSNLLFLNNDIIFEGEALDHMLSILEQDQVGMVGARLFYPDHTLQHAGIFFAIDNIPYHALSTCRDDYLFRDKATSNFMAVTGACMMMKKELFLEIGGFDESFQVAYNDIDLCLKVLQSNHLVVYDGTTSIIHAEYKSRGNNDTEEKKALYQKELTTFLNKWKDMLIHGDWYYNPNLTLLRVDYMPKVRKEKR